MYMDALESRLIDENWISLQQLNMAREEAAKHKKSFWAMLVKLGFLSLDDVCVFFAQESGVPYVKISDYKLSPQILALVEEDFCRRNSLIPLFKIKSALFVACGNPLDTALIDELSKLCGCDIEPLLSPAQAILKALDGYYGSQDKLLELENFIAKRPPLAGLPFWRESERLTLDIPASINIDEASAVLPCSLPVQCHTHDISRNGTALGLEILLYLPKGTPVSLEFRPPKQPEAAIKAKGEIVYCRMEKSRRYFLGIKFTEISDNARAELFSLTAKQ